MAETDDAGTRKGGRNGGCGDTRTTARQPNAGSRNTSVGGEAGGTGMGESWAGHDDDYRRLARVAETMERHGFRGDGRFLGQGELRREGKKIPGQGSYVWSDRDDGHDDEGEDPRRSVVVRGQRRGEGPRHGAVRLRKGI